MRVRRVAPPAPSRASTQLAVTSTAAKAIDDLPLSPRSATLLKDIHAEVADAYRDRFIEMAETLRLQASTLDRIQETLRILVRAVAPTLEGTVPAAVRVARDGENPELASTVVVADPIGAGFTLTQSDVAKALGLANAADISIVVRALKIADDGDCAVTVRRGKRSSIVNFHPRAVDVLRQRIESPPEGIVLTSDQLSAVKRIKKKIAPKAST